MRQRGTHLSSIAAALLFTTLALLLVFIFISFYAHLHRLKSPHLLQYYSYSAPVVPEDDDDQPPSPAVPLPQFSILIGILTRADKYDHRHFLRMVYGIQSSSSKSKVVAHIDVKFIFCNLTKPEQKVLVALEILRFDDVIVLNCTENMNSGKTYTYFSSLPGILRRRRYDYVMKADDDVFIRLAPLAQSLWPLPRRDLYYGFVIPCGSTNPFVEYMSGMGFVLSWDLVEWISVSDIPRNDTFGPEDKLVGKWLNMGKKAKNRFSIKPAMYDYPGTNGRCSHDLIPETVAVHRLKRWDQWSVVLHFFNVTPNSSKKKSLVL